MRSKSGPGGTLYHYGLCEMAQRQAVFVRKDKPPGRAIKSYRAKVVMTAGCISKTFDISNYIYNSRESGNSINQNLAGKEKYEKNFIKVLTEVQICCNIYIVVAEIQQSKALELNACRGCFERSDKKYFKKVLDKRN